jgi:drug/metabolite transporter (DMT)-like permease
MYAPHERRHTVPMPARTRSPRLGYALAASAAAMWALNGSLARFLLDDGLPALRLAQLRSLISFLILAGALALTRRDLLRVRREDLPRLAFMGIAGLAGVHATYFLAIGRLQIGVALAIQYLGPLLVLLWLKFVHHRKLPSTLWAAVAVSVVGSFFVVEAYRANALDGLGLAAAFGAAVTFAIYLVAGERAGHRYPPVTTLVWAFGFASLFWALAQPLWTFPTGYFHSAGNIALGLGVALVGTLFPFLCMVEALRHIPAPRAAIVATLEPVLAAILAYVIHGETLDPPQIAGGLLVMAAVIWVHAQQPSLAEESAPAYMSRNADPAQSAAPAPR